MFGLFNTTKPYNTVSAKQMQEAIVENKDLVILDVRTKDEVRGGYIPGAKHIDFFGPTFAKEVEKLDKNKTYFVYCRSGNRSGSACGLMAQKGFTQLHNLQGGIGAWTGDLKQ